jgi:malate dehydrogenase (oxaloacetate-decarboxylating)(NADP+)
LAFSEAERDAHYLRGLLPPSIVSQELQEKKLMHNLRNYTVPLQRYIAMMDLQVQSQTPPPPPPKV